jgi:hypothetical protein
LLDGSWEVGESGLAAGEEGVGAASGGAGCALREEGGLLVCWDRCFFLGSEVCGVGGVVKRVFGGLRRGFDVVWAVEEFGAEGEGQGVWDHGVDEEVGFGAVDDVGAGVEVWQDAGCVEGLD